MRRFLILVLAYACVLTLGMAFFASMSGCLAPPDSSQPDLVHAWDVAVADLEKAKQTPEPEDDLEAEAALLEIERRATARRLEPITGALPYGIGALIQAAIPLLGSRGRRHYLNAVKSVSRGQLAVAAGDVLKAWGVSHSSPQSAAAAAQPPSSPS
jgi:hypothetical protein